MKISRLLISMAMVALFAFAVGCKKEKEQGDLGTPKVNVVTPEVAFDKAAGSKIVKFTATRDWEAAANQTWVGINPSSGKASAKEQQIEITLLENKGVDRTAVVTITLKGGLGKKTITINQSGTGSAYKSIADLRAMANADMTSETKIEGSLKIKGVVVSNKDLKNLTPAKSIHVQDENAGIHVKLSDNSTFAFGDEVEVDLSGKKLSFYKKALQVDAASVKKLGTKTVEAKEVSIDDLLAGKYASQYVAVKECQVVDADLTKNFGAADKSVSIKIMEKSGKTFFIHTSKSATYKDTKVPQGMGTIKGIATRYEDNFQLFFAQTSDFEGMTGARFAVQGKSMRIAEVFTTTETAVTVKGKVVAMSKTGFILNDGDAKSLSVYTKTEPAVTKGDVVEVVGTRDAANANLKPYVQITDPKITKLTETITESTAAPTALNSDQIDAYGKEVSANYVVVEGRVVESVSNGKTYKNIDFGGKVLGSPASNDLDGQIVKDGFVKITGYYTGMLFGRFTIVPVKVETSTKKFFTVEKSSMEVEANATSAEISVFSNVAWTASSDNAAFTVSPASGSNNGKITVSFAANTETNAKKANITIKTTEDVKTKEFKVTLTQKAAAPSGSMTWTHTLAKGELRDGSVTLNAKEWSFKAEGTSYFGFDSKYGKGCQVGKSAEPAKSITLSSEAFTGTISEIKIETSGAGGTNAKVNVTVGGTKFGEEKNLTNRNVEYSFGGSAKGKIEIKWTQTSKKGIYIKSITVVSAQ